MAISVFRFGVAHDFRLDPFDWMMEWTISSPACILLGARRKLEKSLKVHNAEISAIRVMEPVSAPGELVGEQGFASGIRHAHRASSPIT